MANPARYYQKEIHQNLGFFATWLPADPIALGDIGVFDANRFRKVASLRELGIDSSLGVTGSPQPFNYASSKGASVRQAAETATPVAPVRASIAIEFSREGACVFVADRLRQTRLEDRFALAKAIVAAYQRGVWQKDWRLVESVHEADCASIIVSEGSSAELTIAAEADVDLGPMPLANPNVELTVSSLSGKVMHVIGARDLTPLYACLSVRDRWLSGPTVRGVRGAEADVGDVEALARPSIDELLNS